MKGELSMKFLHGIVGGGATAGPALKIGLTKLARPLPTARRVFTGGTALGTAAGMSVASAVSGTGRVCGLDGVCK